MKYCMECGTELPQRANFCSNCGLQLTGQAAVSWDDEDDQLPEHVPELHTPPVPARPIEPAASPPPPTPPVAPVAAAPLPEPDADSDPLRDPPAPPTFESIAPVAPRSSGPPVPVAPHAFREPYVHGQEETPATDEPVSLSSALPWETEDRDDLVPPPASAYADADASVDEPPPDLDQPPRGPVPPFESYVVEEPAPPIGDGIDVPNAPPTPSTTIPGPQRAKQQNWIMRHKLVAATTAVVSAVVIAAAVNSTGNTPTTSTTQSPGIQLSNAPSLDQEVDVGQAATIGGVQATVTSANFQPTLDESHVEGYLVVDVGYANTSGQNTPYNSLDWKIQSPSGTTTGSESVGTDGQLASGDLADGATVSGKIAFAVGTQKGEFSIVWKPDPVDPARGVWKVPVG